MVLVWVTGSAGVGKSTVCAAVRRRDVRAIDTDWDGYNHWGDRGTGHRVVDPPYPVPAGWLDRYSWRIDIDMVEQLAEQAREQPVVLFGSVENEADVWHLFDLMICLVADDDTLIQRLDTRDTNALGKHPEELAAVLEANQTIETTYRSLGATIIDARHHVDDITDAIIGMLPPS